MSIQRSFNSPFGTIPASDHFRAIADPRKDASWARTHRRTASEDTVVFVLGSRSPADDDWERYVSYYRQAAATRRVQLLVSTESGSPNVKQQLGSRKASTSSVSVSPS